MMQHETREEIERIQEQKMGLIKVKIVQYALSDVFHVWSDCANNGSKKSLLHYIETIFLTHRTKNESVDDLFKYPDK